MTKFLTILIFFMEILTGSMILISIYKPEYRIWPPKEGISMGRVLMPLLFNLTGAGIITLGILDWGKAVFPVWTRVLGGTTWLAGMAVAIWAVICLGAENTSGNPSSLIINGPYRWTRNPQYLGFMAALIGWGLMSSSIITLAAGAAGWLPLILVPRAEEPWLREKYGPAYAEYMKKTPRFLLLQ